MRRPLLFPCILCLVIGLLLGILAPIDWHKEPSQPPVNNALNTPAAPSVSDNAPLPTPAVQPEPLKESDNFSLLSAACAVNRCIQQENWPALSGYVHPERGLTFTPYSTVNPEADLTFTPEQIKNLEQDQTVYTWGFEDGRGDPIKLTIPQYFQRYVYDKDYTQATEIGIDRIITGGNALENLAEAYPGCRFVDFSFPSADPVNDGLDWSSLKLVFQAGGDRWYLVGVVHGEWTI